MEFPISVEPNGFLCLVMLPRAFAIFEIFQVLQTKIKETTLDAIRLFCCWNTINSGLHHTFAAYILIPVRIVRMFHTNQRHANTRSCTHVVVIGHHLKATTYWIPISGGTQQAHIIRTITFGRERGLTRTHTHAHLHIQRKRERTQTVGKKERLRWIHPFSMIRFVAAYCNSIDSSNVQ